MLYLNVGPIFIARGIDRPSTFLIKAGFSTHSAHFILNSKTRSVRLDHIEKLCKLLICEPSDLFAWQPDKDESNANTHPITRLKKNTTQESIRNLIADVPFKQIVEITAVIKEKKEEGLLKNSENQQPL